MTNPLSGLSIALLALLAHPGFMSVERVELWVSRARDQFLDVVNRVGFGGEISSVARGRRYSRAAAIVPADIVEVYESLIDHDDGAVAARRLLGREGCHSQGVPADDVARDLGS